MITNKIGTNYPVKVVLKVVGWDFGHGDNKFFYIKGQDRTDDGKLYHKLDYFSFPSVTYIPVKSAGTSLNSVFRGDSDPYSLTNLTVVYQDTTYFVGLKAVKKDAEGGDQNLQPTRYKEDSAIVQLLAGLAYMFPVATEIEVEYLMVGLSLESFYKYGDDLEKFYTAKEFHFKVPGESGTMRVIKVQIDNVKCSAQGIGAYYDHFIEFSFLKVRLSMANATKMQNTRYGIIDVGYKTIDIFAAEGMETVDNSDVCLDNGIGKLFEDLSAQYGDAPPKTIERDYYAGKSYFYYDGIRYENFQATVAAKIDGLAEEIAKKIYNKWRRYLKQIEIILLCGGGAFALADKLRKLIDINIIVPKDPQFANARGYFKLGFVLRKEFEADDVA